MSVFSFEGGGVEEIYVKVTSSAAKVIVDATVEGPRFVSWFDVTENAGSTPNLTVDVYDVANSLAYYLGSGGTSWRARAVTADQSVRFDQGYVIPYGWQLRVTSSDAAGKFGVSGLMISRTPTAHR